MTMGRIRASIPAWPALAVVAAFFVMQSLTLGYGTHINDLPHIRDYRVSSDIFRRSGLNREQLIGSATHQDESLDVWMVRFKLYSVEADEAVAIMALARIKPGQLHFDPGFYQYGGAFLYPLGVWYFALSKLGVVHVAPLEQMLATPQAMDAVWIAGRAFVLAAFAISGVLLFMALNEMAPRGVALCGLLLYLLCPASIMYSQVIKPHWYALLWVTGALLIITRAVTRGRWSLQREVLLGACLGLAVGSAATFSPFAVLAWCALAALALRRVVTAWALVRVPAIALAAFVASNPYYVLNWHAVQTERAAAQSWFAPSFSVGAIAEFVQSSMLSGFGVAFTALIFALGLWRLVRGPSPARLYAIAVFVPIVVIAVMTANMASWNVNFRYISYLFPAAVILLAAGPWRYRTPVLTLAAALTAAQAAPLKLAYVDENSPNHSTRFLAAAWINSHIPKGDAICLTTPNLAPYEVPPFRFDQYRINAPNCGWSVRIERQPLVARTDPSETIAQRFTPRLSPQVFPLVWEHINPQITIYRRND